MTQMVESERDRRKQWKEVGGTHTISEELTSQSGTMTKGVLDQDRYLKSAFIAQDAIVIGKEAVLPAVIRRTGKSKQPDGQPVLSLESCIQSVVWLVLGQTERENLEKVTNCTGRDGT
jgi:hypothetical protein